MAEDEVRSALVNALLNKYVPEPTTADILARMQTWGGLKSYVPESARNAMADFARFRNNAMSYIPSEAMLAANFLSPGARVPMRPMKLEKGLAGEPGYAYHATNAERLQDIADSGTLNVHRPHEFTDQDVWPDMSTERRSYFGGSPEHLWQFAPEEGTPVVLRTKTGGHIFKESTGDLFARKPIEAAQLEYLGEDGGWHPVSGLRNSESQ